MKKAVLLVLCLLTMLTPVYAGSKVIMKPKSTNYVFVGDSRFVEMWEYGYNSKSLIASRGGRYNSNDSKTIHSKKYGKDQSNQVDYDKSRKKAIFDAIDNCLASKKNCKVVMLATINECHTSHAGSETTAATKLVDFAKECKNRTKKVNGKTYTTKVYVYQAPRAGKSKRDKYPNSQVSKYNSAVVSKCASAKITCNSLKTPDEKDYTDGLHFTKSYTSYMWNQFTEL